MTERHHLKLLTYNIQVGIETSRYHHYLTKAWRYALPFRSRHENLNRIAQILAPYDLVALQETDAGSLRSNYVDQVAHLAEQAGFPYWHTRINRRLGRWARHSMGLLSRYRPTEVREVSLPSGFPAAAPSSPGSARKPTACSSSSPTCRSTGAHRPTSSPSSAA